MQTISQHDFARIPPPQISRSSFDRSSGHKTTMNAGFLIPIFYDEALPGDTFKLDASFFARLNTPIVPILDNIHFETFFFEVPVRQVWDNWQKFNGEQTDPGDSTDYLIPTIDAGVAGFPIGTVADHFGLPTQVPDIVVSALPFRAYQLIYNEWFRDQNLIDSRDVPKDDGPDTLVPMNALQLRGKRHDYFTSALPWPQKSDSGAVTIPLGTSAPVNSDGTVPSFHQTTNTGFDHPLVTQAGSANAAWNAVAGGADTMEFSNSGLVADLTSATAATINQLRQSIAVQRLFEKDARGGTRYIEVIKSHFGVTSPDLRLQRPGYLGGGHSMVNISPVAQTTPTDTLTPQANLAAIGTMSDRGHGFTRSFTEHSIIIGIGCFRADLTYQRNIERSWSRRTRFDFYWPELATIGEQEVLNKEIYAQGTAADDDVFGYQERFAEYRYKPSLITGEMRSYVPNSLDVWHLSQDFSSLPVLGKTFIEENPPIGRVIALPTEPQFKMDMYFNLKCARPMPMYGVPGLTRL